MIDNVDKRKKEVVMKPENKIIRIPDKDNVFIPTPISMDQFEQAIDKIVHSNDKQSVAKLPPLPIIYQVLQNNPIKRYDNLDLTAGFVLPKDNQAKIQNEADLRHNGSHELSTDELKDVYRSLADPAMVLRSETSGGLVVVTDKILNGMPLVVVISQHDKSNNRLASAFGKTNLQDWFERQAALDNVLYVNPSKKIANNDTFKMLGFLQDNKHDFLLPRDVVRFSNRLFDLSKDKQLTHSLDKLAKDNVIHAVFNHVKEQGVVLKERDLQNIFDRKMLIDGFLIQTKEGVPFVNGQQLDVKPVAQLFDRGGFDSLSTKGRMAVQESIDFQLMNQHRLRMAYQNNEPKAVTDLIESKLIATRMPDKIKGLIIDNDLPDGEKITKLRDFTKERTGIFRNKVSIHRQKVVESVFEPYVQAVSDAAAKAIVSSNVDLKTVREQVAESFDHPNKQSSAIQQAIRGNYEFYAKHLRHIMILPLLKNGKEYTPFKENKPFIDLLDSELSKSIKFAKNVSNNLERLQNTDLPEFGNKPSNLLMMKTCFLDRNGVIRNGSGAVSNNLTFRPFNHGEFGFVNQSFELKENNIKSANMIVISVGGHSAAATASVLSQQHRYKDALFLDAMTHQNVGNVCQKIRQFNHDAQIIVFSEDNRLTRQLQIAKDPKLKVTQGIANTSWGHFISSNLKDFGTDKAMQIINSRIHKELEGSDKRQHFIQRQIDNSPSISEEKTAMTSPEQLDLSQQKRPAPRMARI